MASKKTPLIQQLRDKSGTVYVFPSASEDIGLNLDTDVNGVALTHYALLNIPQIDRDTWLFKNAKGTEKGNLVISKSLLNYMMNFETALLNKETYNYQDYNTVTERVFWHWFNKINSTSLKSITYGGTQYFYNDSKENRIVKCFGSIDAGNSLSGEFGVFNETYINIPSSYGSAPVFFVLNFDTNYQSNSTVSGDADALQGRTDNLSYISYTENDDKPYYDNVKNNQYVISNVNDGYEIVKDPLIIQELLKIVSNNDNVTAYTLDEVNIDPNNQYSDLIDTEFQFNAILLYYSIYDQSSTIKTAQATNLFGIIFLDGCTDTDDESVSYIQPITKRKSTAENFGTGYSFRVNIRTMSIYDNTDAVIQDNTTLNSVITNDLSEAVSQLNRATDLLMLNTQTINTIRDLYDSVLDYYYTQRSDVKDLSTLINSYIQGKTVSKIDVAEARITDFYVNTDDNRYKFYVKTGQNDEYNEPIYNDIVTINEDGITTTDINAEDVYLQHGWYLSAKHVDLNNNENDPAVLLNVDKIDNTNNIKTSINNAQTLLKDMFDSSSNLIINLYNNNSDQDYNRLYISSDSPVFNSNNLTCVSYLKQIGTLGQQSKIDYVGLIPYIIAEIQSLNSYTYDSTNVIESTDDIHSLRDAIDYIIGIINQNTKDYTVVLTINAYRNYGLSTLETVFENYTYEKGDTSVFEYYNGQNITFEYNFIISENSTNAITQILINDLNIKSVFDDEDKIDSIEIDGVKVENLSTYRENDIDYFTGAYLVTPDGDSTTNTITLKGNSVGLPTSKNYISTMKRLTKLYYWACFKNIDSDEIDLEHVFVYYQYNGESNNEDGNLAQYLDDADTEHTLDKLKSITMNGTTLESTELTIDGMSGNHGAYIYIMVPEECTSSIKIGVGTQLHDGGIKPVFDTTTFTLTEFDKGVNYCLYRTIHPQAGQVNIQIG